MPYDSTRNDTLTKALQSLTDHATHRLMVDYRGDHPVISGKYLGDTVVVTVHEQLCTVTRASHRITEHAYPWLVGKVVAEKRHVGMFE
jgi:CMP-2-keto-3-deoxyoctulosonic acid synthetase